MRSRVMGGNLVVSCLVTLFLTGCQGGMSGAGSVVPDSALNVWNFVGGKVEKMVEAFPEDKYTYRPTPETRTFAEQVVHLIAVQNRYITMAGGQPPDPPPAEGVSKESLLAATRASMAAGRAWMEEEGPAAVLKTGDLWIEAINHTSEHYGQLVFYFRLNGLVPPSSQPGSGQR